MLVTQVPGDTQHNDTQINVTLLNGSDNYQGNLDKPCKKVYVLKKKWPFFFFPHLVLGEGKALGLASE